MNSNKKDGRLAYEPPRIYEIEADLTQAMGASNCKNGPSAAGNCNGGCNVTQGSDNCRGGKHFHETGCMVGTWYGWAGCRPGTRG